MHFLIKYIFLPQVIFSCPALVLRSLSKITTVRIQQKNCITHVAMIPFVSTADYLANADKNANTYPGWFWMGNLHKNIQLRLEFLRAPFWVLHFSVYTLMTFMMMLSVILLSMLMILLSTLNVVRHLICDNKQNWLLNLNLICETLWTGARSGMLISMLEKLNWFCWTGLITQVLLMCKSMGLFWRKNHLLRCWG